MADAEILLIAVLLPACSLGALNVWAGESCRRGDRALTVARIDMVWSIIRVERRRNDRLLLEMMRTMSAIGGNGG